MKKLLIASIMLVGFSSLVSAQAVKKTEPSKSTEMKVVKKTEPAKTTEMKVVKEKEPKAAKVVKMKANSDGSVTPGSSTPLKADGTPDKRFKANKKAEAPAAGGPVKKDGTPDMRYKENKKK